ncbi:MAG: hypothetical protein DRR19_15605 [Candidatus Parabeggiatoa sp. nov. 1]|nr:MAG: hypothetical protein DRR19_15605 [Gammaproteobacteria bacterium]
MQSRLFWVILLFLFSSGCHGPTVEKNNEAQTVFQVGNRLHGWYHGKDHDDHYLDKVQPSNMPWLLRSTLPAQPTIVPRGTTWL